MKTFFVYILASNSGVLYVGMTNDLHRRIYEHKHKLVPGFKYNCDRLVWFEDFSSAGEAIATEKRIKGWRREKKADSIAERNPAWADLNLASNALLPELNVSASEALQVHP